MRRGRRTAYPPPIWDGSDLVAPPAVRNRSPQITDTIGDFGQNWAQKGPPKAPTKAQISQISATRAPSHPPTPKTSPKQAKITKISATRGPGPQRGRGQTTGGEARATTIKQISATRGLRPQGGEARATHNQANQRHQGPATTGGEAPAQGGRGSTTGGRARRPPTTHDPSLGRGSSAPGSHQNRNHEQKKQKKTKIK